MKNILSIIAVLLVLSCCEESSQRFTKHDLLKSSLRDTIIYYRTSNVDFFKLPTCAGKYICPPLSCVNVDCDTPRVFSSSCSGVPCPLRCVSKNDTTWLVVVISGIHYPDGPHCFGKKEFVKPNYNASNHDAPHGSQFDVPPAGEPSASSQGLSIDARTGYIDIDKSIAKALFGNAPHPGDHKTLRIYYKLNDLSNHTRNYTDVTFFYDSLASNTRLNSVPGGASTVIIKKARCL